MIDKRVALEGLNFYNQTVPCPSMNTQIEQLSRSLTWIPPVADKGNRKKAKRIEIGGNRIETYLFG